MINNKIKFILASKSIWRRNLAEKELNLKIINSIAGINERKVVEEGKPKTPIEHVQMISKAKLDYFFIKNENNNTEDFIALCYDTIVYCDSQILEKPKDDNDLKRMMSIWGKKDKITQIYTGIAIGRNSTNKKIYDVALAEVKFIRDFTKEEFDNYFNNKDVRQSSGGCIIELLSKLNIVKIIKGSIDIILGLPIENTKKIIKELL